VRILGRMLEKNPSDRYQSCDELNADLHRHPLATARCCSSTASRTTPPRRPWSACRRRGPAATGRRAATPAAAGGRTHPAGDGAAADCPPAPPSRPGRSRRRRCRRRRRRARRCRSRLPRCWCWRWAATASAACCRSAAESRSRGRGHHRRGGDASRRPADAGRAATGHRGQYRSCRHELCGSGAGRRGDDHAAGGGTVAAGGRRRCRWIRWPRPRPKKNSSRPK
jgi:hypothetical protein